MEYLYLYIILCKLKFNFYLKNKKIFDNNINNNNILSIDLVMILLKSGICKFQKNISYNNFNID